MKRFAAFAIFLSVATPLAAQQTADLTPSGDPAPLRAVKLIKAGGDTAQLERTFFGQVAALETVDLSFEVGGRLTMFDAQEGQFVESGVQIAALEKAGFERAVERAELELAQAERALSRAQTLAQSNAGSETQAENALTARDLAAVSLREARDALADAVLVAPFKALVASRLTPNFSNVTPGQPIVRLHDMSEVRVEINVPERLFQSRGSADAIAFFGRSPLFAGEVPLQLREFNAETQSIGQSYRVTFALPQAEVPAAIIPGASMTVVARFGGPGDTQMVLPPSAVEMTGDTAQVMVYTPAGNGADDGDGGETGTVSWLPVDISSANGTQIIVSGLDPETLIVAAGIQLLHEGDVVRPFLGLSTE